MRHVCRVLGFLVVAQASGLGTAHATGDISPPEASRPALTIRAVQPDTQLARLLALFEGERVRHPAEALAAWRRATGGHDGISKAAQATLAVLNPEMVRELRLLRDAEFRLGFGATRADRPWWGATMPGDDGSFAAMGAALALTDGAAMPPVEGLEVDRLGPPGTPLMARDESNGVALASDPKRLDEAVARLRDPGRPEIDGVEGLDGWVARLDVSALGVGADGPEDLARRRVAEGLAGLGCRAIEADAALHGEVLEIRVSGMYPDGPPVDAPLDPSWLDWVPADRVAGALAFATDEAGAAWNAAFAAADRVDRADPARAEAAPLRARLGLLALAAGIRPEADLWPLMRGATACVLADEAGELDGALLVLHARDDASARRIARRVIRPLAARLGAEDFAAWIDDESTTSAYDAAGSAFGRPLELTIRGRSVVVAWGVGVMAMSLEARAFPGRSAGSALREAWPALETVPQRAGALWPGRVQLAGLAPDLAGSAFEEALDDSSPILWWGMAKAAATLDHVRIDGLQGIVHRTLERLPLELEIRSERLE